MDGDKADKNEYRTRVLLLNC